MATTDTPTTDTADTDADTLTSTSSSTRRGSVEQQLRSALQAHPGSTAKELALAAGVAQSTASKTLTRWAADGAAVKTVGEGTSGRGRTPDRWSLADRAADTRVTGTAGFADTPDATETADGEPVGAADTTPERADDPIPVDAGEESAAGPTRRRLTGGSLRGMVEDYLREHPDESFGPSQIGKALNRSGGAVANALVILNDAGTVTLTQIKPKRYALATGR